jgi:hypothetical protein
MNTNEKQKRIDKQRVIHLNCNKLFLCNLELRYIFEQADQQEKKNYNSDKFLQFYIENLNVNFCMLSSILISDKEEFSITKFIADFVQDGQMKKKDMGNSLRL